MNGRNRLREILGDQLEIIDPAPDGQYRLRRCSCGSDRVRYARNVTIRGVEWAAGCQSCGKITRWWSIRHSAQIEWNGKEPPSWDRD